MTKLQYPQDLTELLSWPYQGQYISDKLGGFQLLTGFEGEPNICYWCGGELTGRAKRWCRIGYGTDNAHWYLYHRHFDWNYAADWCEKRYDNKCANCGAGGKHEIHHIIPLNGVRPQYSLYHLPWNLMCLCHDCHVEVGNVMRAKAIKLPLIPAKLDDLPLFRGIR